MRNLLKVAHRDTGERTLVDLHQLLNETIALRQHDFTAAGIGLCLVPCEDAILMEASELELQQVFLNIINNALDALKGMPGGPALTIRTMAAAGSATVTLEDNGPGMKDPRKVFDHFYTTKEIGKGTGLGLSITHAIVQNPAGQSEAWMATGLKPTLTIRKSNGTCWLSWPSSAADAILQSSGMATVFPCFDAPKDRARIYELSRGLGQLAKQLPRAVFVSRLARLWYEKPDYARRTSILRQLKLWVDAAHVAQPLLRA